MLQLLFQCYSKKEFQGFTFNSFWDINVQWRQISMCGKKSLKLDGQAFYNKNLSFYIYTYVREAKLSQQALCMFKSWGIKDK